MDIIVTATTTIVSVVLGGVIALLVSRWYYRKASEDLEREARMLREESAKLKRFSILMLRAIEELGASGTVKLNRDPETGEPVGLQFQVSAVMSGSSNVSVDADVIRTETSSTLKRRWPRFVHFVRSFLRSFK